MKDPQNEGVLREVKSACASIIASFSALLDSIQSFDANLSTLRYSLPLSDEDIKTLEVLPSRLEDAAHQQIAGTMTLFASFIDTVAAFDKPNRVIMRPDGEVLASWWDAGSLSLTRQRANALADGIEQLVQVLAHISKENPGRPFIPPVQISQRAPWSRELRTAMDLISMGYARASLGEIYHALLTLAATRIGIDRNKLTLPLSSIFTNSAGLSHLSTDIQCLESALAVISIGASLDTGTSTLLATRLINTTTHLIVTADSSAWKQSDGNQ